MRTLAIWFENTVKHPECALALGIVACGMPGHEFDALLGHGHAIQKRYEVPEVLGGALVRFPD